MGVEKVSVSFDLPMPLGIACSSKRSVKRGELTGARLVDALEEPVRQVHVHDGLIRAPRRAVPTPDRYASPSSTSGSGSGSGGSGS